MYMSSSLRMLVGAEALWPIDASPRWGFLNNTYYVASLAMLHPFTKKGRKFTRIDSRMISMTKVIVCKTSFLQSPVLVNYPVLTGR